MVIVICRPAEGVEASEFQSHLDAELAALRTLRASGSLLDAWSIGSPGAILRLATSPEHAASIVDSLPLARAGLLASEIYPIAPIPLDVLD